MKRSLALLSFLLFGLHLSLAAQSPKGYSGRIGKFPIGMELTQKDRTLSGRYGYLNKLQWLLLKGEVAGNRIRLVEFEVKGNENAELTPTGSFNGIIQPDSSISGTWTSADEKKSFPFLLTRDRLTFAPGSITFDVQDFSKPDCECFVGSSFRITDSRLGPYHHCVLLWTLNGIAMDADRECPCWLGEYSSVPQGDTEGKIEVIYNQHNLLTYVLTVSATGAYSWTQSEHITIDLQTGENVSANSFFKQESIPEVHQYIHAELSKELDQVIKSLNANDPVNEIREWGERKLEEFRNGLGLYSFVLTDSTFAFDLSWGTHRTDYALSPDTQVFIPREKLLAWIDPKGRLAFMLEKK